MDDLFLDRTLPELRPLLEAIGVVAALETAGDPELTALMELCCKIRTRRGGLPLVEYLRVLAK
jgi:hypothetical protein